MLILFHSQVVPNPGSASLVYSLITQQNGTLNLRITNLAGQLIYEQKTAIVPGQQDFRVNTTGWTGGMYILNATLDGYPVAVDKWVKQ